MLGNIATPIPVRLDGQTRTVTVPLEAIAYTMETGDSVTLQIVDSATSYEDFTAYGVIGIANVELRLPVRYAAGPVPVPA